MTNIQKSLETVNRNLEKISLHADAIHNDYLRIIVEKVEESMAILEVNIQNLESKVEDQ